MRTIRHKFQGMIVTCQRDRDLGGAMIKGGLMTFDGHSIRSMKISYPRPQDLESPQPKSRVIL